MGVYFAYWEDTQLQSDKTAKKDMPGWWRRYLPAGTIAISEKRRDKR